MRMVAEVAELPTWKNRLARKKNGEPYADERNVRIALEEAPELKGILQYDEFRDRIELRRPLPGMPRDDLNKLFQDDEVIAWSDEHITELTIWLTTQGFVFLRRSVIQDTVIAVAKRNSYHPVRSYLMEAEAAWDSKPRLNLWLRTYLGAKDNDSYLEAIGAKFMIGAVARIFEPGCQMDSILVLEGEQGRGKSTAARILGRNRWTYDMSGDLGSKDAAVAIQSVWIGEMAELTSLRRSEQESIKAFISRRIDHYRPPYGRNAIERPRHTVFIATTNENDYLQDPTGARRFWPVECTAIDLAALARDADQLWGEATARYLAKETWHLSDAQARRATIEQASRQRLSPVDTLVLEYADSLLAAGLRRIEMRALLAEVFDISTKEKPANAGALAQQASRTLVREGWRRLKPTGRGQNRTQAYEYTVVSDDSQPAQASQANGSCSPDAHHEPLTSSQASQAENSNDIPF